MAKVFTEVTTRSRKLDSPTKQPISQDELQRETAELMIALNTKLVHDAARQEIRRKLITRLTLQAEAIKSFRVALSKNNNNKTLTCDQVMQFCIDQYSLAGKFYTDFYDYYQPGNAESIRRKFIISVNDILAKTSYQVRLANGTVQTKFTSVNFYDEYNILVRTLEDSHHLTRAFYKPYALRLTSATDHAPEAVKAGKIYINAQGQYWVRAPNGIVRTGQLPENLGVNSDTVINKLADAEFRKAVLAFALQANHIRDRDPQLYSAFSKYSVQLQKLAFVFYFGTRPGMWSDENAIAEATMSELPSSFARLKQFFFQNSASTNSVDTKNVTETQKSMPKAAPSPTDHQTHFWTEAQVRDHESSEEDSTNTEPVVYKIGNYDDDPEYLSLNL